MTKSYRFVSLGLFLALGASLVAVFTAEPRPEAAAPALLPAAFANPAEVGYSDTLHAGETLSQLLERARLAEDEATQVLASLQEYQDPRRLHPGAVIEYRRGYADGVVRGVALRLDADRTLSVQRAANGWQGRVEEVPVRPDTVVLTGTVESSLYAALLGTDSEIPAPEREQVADLLADRVFAWQIDFSRDLRVGDEFRVLYERMARPDGTARSGRIVAAEFRIDGRDYDAYAYSLPDGVFDYYDAEGESVRRAFLRAPLEFRRISSAFSTGRFHPILKKSRPHLGIDYAAGSGTPIRAVGDGVVRRAGWGNGFGNVVEITHKRGYVTRYAHMKGFAKGIRSGVRVKQGDVIGYVGMTGLATGPHLHFEFHENGRAIDPKKVESISGEPVPRRYRDAFAVEMRGQIATLDDAAAPVLLAHIRTQQRARGN